jgi:hypothetical protein
MAGIPVCTTRRCSNSKSKCWYSALLILIQYCTGSAAYNTGTYCNTYSTVQTAQRVPFEVEAQVEIKERRQPWGGKDARSAERQGGSLLLISSIASKSRHKPFSEFKNNVFGD